MDTTSGGSHEHIGMLESKNGQQQRPWRVLWLLNGIIRIPPTSPPPAAHFLTASPPPTNRLPATRPPPCHRLATPCAPSARCHQPTSCQPPAHHYVACRPTTASPSPSHPTSAKKVIYDPQSFCVYVLNAGGFWQCRDARRRLMCDKPS